MGISRKFIFSFFCFFKFKNTYSINFLFIYFCFNFVWYFRKVFSLAIKIVPKTFFYCVSKICDKKFRQYFNIHFFSIIKFCLSELLMFKNEFVFKYLNTASHTSRFTVLRAPFVYKNSREVFEIRSISGWFGIEFLKLISFFEIDFFLYFFQQLFFFDKQVNCFLKKQFLCLSTLI